MASSDQYVMTGDPPNRHAEMVCAIWKQTPRTHVFIGAPDRERLAAAWLEITGLELDKLSVQDVHVFAANHDPCSPQTTRDTHE